MRVRDEKLLLLMLPFKVKESSGVPAIWKENWLLTRKPATFRRDLFLCQGTGNRSPFCKERFGTRKQLLAEMNAAGCKTIDPSREVGDQGHFSTSPFPFALRAGGVRKEGVTWTARTRQFPPTPNSLWGKKPAGGAICYQKTQLKTFKWKWSSKFLKDTLRTFNQMITKSHLFYDSIRNWY